MENNNYQNSLMYYYKNDTQEVKKTIKEIVDFVDVFGISKKTVYESLWNLSEEISQNFDKVDLDYPGIKQEQKILSLFPILETRSFLLDFKFLMDNFFIFNKVTEFVENKKNVSLDEVEQKLLNFDFSFDFVKNFSVKNVSLEEKSELLFKINDLTNRYESLKIKLGAIMSYMGYFSHITFYNNVDVQNIIESGSEDIDFIKLAGTIRESIWSDHGLSLSSIILNFLNNQAVFKNEDYEWYDAFLLGIFLHQVFYHFNYLFITDKEFLLNFYFYKGLIVDAPVQEVLKKALFETTNVVDYVEENLFLYESIYGNQESIYIEFENKQKEELGNLFDDYLKMVGNNIHDGYKLESFLNNLYSKTNNKNNINILRKAFFIFTHLKTVDLLDRNIGSIPSDDLIYNTELEALIIWFFDENSWFLISEYYSKPNPFVPLKTFLQQLVDNFSIKEEKNTSKILDFTDFLKQNNLLSPDKDLISFDEVKDEFIWNNDLGI